MLNIYLGFRVWKAGLVLFRFTPVSLLTCQESTNMPEIKLKHVVSCSTQDAVSTLLWIYGHVCGTIPYFLLATKSRVSIPCSHHLSWCQKQTHKADNLLSSDTYRKWKAAKPGEKQTFVILQVVICPFFLSATRVTLLWFQNVMHSVMAVLVATAC